MTVRELMKVLKEDGWYETEQHGSHIQFADAKYMNGGITMRKVTYFAVFEPSDSGYSIYFPDLPGCVSCGDNIKHAMRMAKEALGLHYWSLEKDGDKIPESTNPPFEGMERGDFIIPIEIFPDIVKGAIENRAVKKTLTIPYWLNAEAEAEDVNFSQILQNALKEYLRVEI